MDATRATWRKSSRSGDNGGHCVELADLTSAVGIRDGKSPEAGHLRVTRSEPGRLIAPSQGERDGLSHGSPTDCRRPGDARCRRKARNKARSADRATAPSRRRRSAAALAARR